MRIMFALVAWGADYVRDFLDVSLPTLLADGNLDATDVRGSKLLIMTMPADVAAFEASPLIAALRRTLPTQFFDISRLRARDKYRFASRCQLEALRLSEDFDAVILLYPDMIWCRGGVRYAIERLRKGSLALFAPAPAVLPRLTLEALRSRTRTWTDGRRSISIAPRDLAALALRHHHPMWDGFNWDGGAFTDYPSCLRWNLANRAGWLIHCFHLHPVAMRVQPDNPRFIAPFATSLDGEYVARLFEGTDDLAFAQDSDEFCMVTLRDRRLPPFPRPGQRASAAVVARWAEGNAFLLHRAFAAVPFRWHSEAVAEAAWQAAEQRAGRILADVRDRLHTPDLVLRAEDPLAYRARRQRARSAAYHTRAIELPPSYARQPRGQLAAALLGKTAYNAACAAKDWLAPGPIGRWLRQNPAAVALWTRTKRTFEPETPIHAAASTRSFLRSILAPKR